MQYYKQNLFFLVMFIDLNNQIFSRWEKDMEAQGKTLVENQK